MIEPDDLFKYLRRHGELPVVTGSGIYAICIVDTESLPPVTLGAHGLLYIGMTDDGLDVRNHFTHAHSGFSTFRRSLGALLKAELDLVAYPRSAGPSKTNTQNYRFTDAGEARLTSWMMANLLLAQMRIDQNVVAREKELIELLQPPLNLTGWGNPQRAMIKALRAACVQEAVRSSRERI